MIIPEALALFALSFTSVTAKAFQQKNVMHDAFLKIVPTSYVMTACEYGGYALGIRMILDDPIIAIGAGGTAAWMGCWLAVYTHKKVHE